jgi:GMP synthase (glutamine-hydrolysing)
MATTDIQSSILVLQMGLNDFVGKHFSKIFSKRFFRVEVIRVIQGEIPSHKDWNEYVGIIVTGSSFFVTDSHPWSVATGERLQKIVLTGITPVLGICYGHQLILHSLGAEVEFLEKRQLGGKSCTLTAEATEDPLFSVFEGRKLLHVNVLHRQKVVTLPASINVTTLANSVDDEYHACRIGARCWTVQFHPEILTKTMRTVIESQKEVLHKDGLDYGVLLNTLQETNDGSLLLNRFADICVARSKEKFIRL